MFSTSLFHTPTQKLGTTFLKSPNICSVLPAAIPHHFAPLSSKSLSRNHNANFSSPCSSHNRRFVSSLSQQELASSIYTVNATATDNSKLEQTKPPSFHSLQYNFKPSFISSILRNSLHQDFESVHVTTNCHEWKTDLLLALNHLPLSVDTEEHILMKLNDRNLRVLDERNNTAMGPGVSTSTVIPNAAALSFQESLKQEDDDEFDFSDAEDESLCDDRRAYLYKKYSHFINMKWFGLDEDQMDNFEQMVNGFTSLLKNKTTDQKLVFNMWIRIFRYFFNQQEDNQEFPLRLVNGGEFKLTVNKDHRIGGAFKHRLVSNDEHQLNYVSFSGPCADDAPSVRLPSILATMMGAASQNFSKIPQNVKTQELYHMHMNRESVIVFHLVVHRDYLLALEEKNISAPRFDDLTAIESNLNRNYLVTREYGPLHMNDTEDREVFMDILDRIYYNSLKDMKTGNWEK